MNVFPHPDYASLPAHACDEEASGQYGIRIDIVVALVSYYGVPTAYRKGSRRYSAILQQEIAQDYAGVMCLPLIKFQ